MVGRADIKEGVNGASCGVLSKGDRLGYENLVEDLGHPLVCFLDGECETVGEIAQFGHQVADVTRAPINDCAAHLNKCTTRALGQDLDTAEVHESDCAVQPEAVVARMWVGI